MPSRRDVIEEAALLALGSLLQATRVEATIEGRSQSPQVRRAAEPVLTSPTKIPPGPLEISVLRLRLEPGSKSQPHRHPGPVAGYVVSGSVIVEVKGESRKTFRPGDAFLEPFESIHQSFENPSTSEPAEVIAFLVGPVGQPAAMPVK